MTAKTATVTARTTMMRTTRTKTTTDTFPLVS